MMTEKKLEHILCQISQLPDEARAELVRSIVEIHLQDLGIPYVDDDGSDTLET